MPHVTDVHKSVPMHTHTAIQIHMESTQGPKKKSPLQESNHFDQDENTIQQ